jgi:hypothetical protein
MFIGTLYNKKAYWGTSLILKNRENYLTCLKFPGLVPLDNNKAERGLRQLVIKRKISYGSKTDKGAETTSILAFVLLSLKWMNPYNFFQKYFLRCEEIQLRQKIASCINILQNKDKLVIYTWWNCQRCLTVGYFPTFFDFISGAVYNSSTVFIRIHL